MLTEEQQRLIYQHAFVPEHLPAYVQSVSGAEACLHEDYLCYVLKDHLLFVGYPLVDRDFSLEEAYESACKRFRPATVAIIARNIPFRQGLVEEQPPDSYYKIDLPVSGLAPGVAYMIRRGARELRVSEGMFGKEHEQLVSDFLVARELGHAHGQIFGQIPKYLEASRTALLLEARTGDRLAAFVIVDFGSADYGFYMFNFRSLIESVPGASDLLFHRMTQLAQQMGKQAINLGLGINFGVVRFKEKWGASPFLPCESAMIRRRSKSWLSILAGR